jgi:hypothetical protein
MSDDGWTDVYTGNEDADKEAAIGLSLSRSTGLLDCPFCGTNNPIMKEMATGEYWVQCRGCRANSDGYMDAHQAAFAWNRRQSNDQVHAPTERSEGR